MDSSLMKFCKQLQSIAKLFRFVELCILLCFLSWLSSRLPFVVKISGQYCKLVIFFILSPVPIFLLGNVIVIILLTKSGLFSGKASVSIDNAVAEFYDELRSENPDEISRVFEKEEEVVFQDKEIICEENKKVLEEVPEEVVFVENEVKMVSYRRSKSENLRRECGDEEAEVVMMKNDKLLRRSETDIYQRNFDAVVGEEIRGDDDGLDNEEFQRMIEAFIAKQVRFHREERLAVVLHSQA